MTRFLSLPAAVLAFVCLASPLVAEDTLDKNVGITVETVGDMFLPPQFSRTDGRSFRMRMITVEPKGIIAYHSHGDPIRPSLEYVLSGTGIEHRDGMPDPNTYESGGLMQASKEVSHWWENPGDTVLIILAFDIYCAADFKCPD